VNQDNLNKLITQALAIEETEAREAGAIGYMARMLVQATLPHSDPKASIFERVNGNLSLVMMGHPQIGLPYGTYPRLILSWLVTEAVRTKSQELILGTSLSDFMSALGLLPTGGRWGNIARLRDQLRRLFGASISCAYIDGMVSSGMGFNLVKEYNLWWDPKSPGQTTLWQSNVILGTDFFNEIIDRPVPIDMRALRALKGSAMALDLYCWLTYRLSYLKQQTEIPWMLLQRQFGADYADTKQGRYTFKKKLLTQLKKVMAVYNGAAKTSIGEYGLVLSPSNSHVKKIDKLTLLM
jgi:hypothetical protein